MPSLKSKSRLFTVRAMRTGTRLGIDIGQRSTKIVRYVPGSQPEYSCVSIDTLAGTVNTDAPSPFGALVTNADQDPDQKEEGPSRRKNDLLDFSRWSSKQTKSLAERIAVAVGETRSTIEGIDVTISMAACELRSIYGEEAHSLASIHQKLKEITNDTRKRNIAVLSGDKEGSKTCTISIPEELTETIATQLDRHGLTPDRIEAVPWSVARVMPNFRTSSEKVQIALDWGFGYPTLVCTVDGKIEYVRRIHVGGVHQLISQAIRDLGFSKSEAIRWLELCTSSDDPEYAANEKSDTREWIGSCCRQLAREINIAIEFIVWRNKGADVNGIVLTGGAPMVPGLANQLQASLTIPVKTWESKTAGSLVTSEYAIASCLADMGGGK